MKNNNSKAKQNCGATYMVSAVISLVLIAVSVFVYWYIPVSDIANSIEHSPKDALWLLALAPACAGVAAIVYLVGGLTDKALVKNSVVQLVIFIVSAVLLLFAAGTSVGLFISQFSLGFVAPVGGTIWQTLGILNIVAAVLYAAGNIYIFATARK